MSECSPTLAHIESEGAYLSVSEAFRTRIRQQRPGNTPLAKIERKFYGAIIQGVIKTAAHEMEASADE